MICPECNSEGHVERLVSGGSGRGVVILTGRELRAHIKAEGTRIAKEAKTNENIQANMVGEERYHQQALQTSQLTNELVKIGKETPPTPPAKSKIRRIG